ncbi:hypothetical protein [Porticoccus hydrocarbonoclasticus]|uniref:hypothetical protein n=1 Tax=Porticoccus hydrocarbonoclasticus TaxID=1073414 RepID=UPI0030EE7CFD
MVILDEFYHAPLALLAFVLGFFVIVTLSGAFRVGSKLAVFLYFWHTAFALVYFYYSLIDVADATKYYSLSLGYDDGFSVGTGFVIYFTAFFSDLVGLDYFGVFLIYNILGSVGLLAFYASLKEVLASNFDSGRRLMLFVVLLPSVSFWSSAIGKDSISFMAVGLSLWASLSLPRRLPVFVVAFLFMLLVRPHISGIMLIALSLTYVFDFRGSLMQRLVFSFFGLLAAFFSVSYAVNYAGLSGISVGELSQYIDDRQAHNMTGGGGIDISSMSLPYQLFTYLFRPLPFEAKNITQLIASFDNFLILVLFVFGVVSLIKGRSFAGMAGWIYMLSYSIGCWVVLAITTANLGIAVRQKWMFLPMMIVLLIVLVVPRRRLCEDQA